MTAARYVAVAVVAIVTLGACGPATVPTPTSAATILPTLPDAFFSDMGLVITQPSAEQRASAVVTRDEAAVLVVSGIAGIAPRSSALIVLGHRHAEVQPNGLFWIFDVSPARPTEGPAPTAYLQYTLALADAVHRGGFVAYLMEGGEPHLVP